jgi:aryl-alcohol dehydrogenase-like predicted oxidoreductase
MQALNDVVHSGKVMYLGVSDTPAWVVAKCNQYARDHGLRQFSVYQGNWSVACRDFERDIIPMTISENMSLAPWGALGGGQFKTAAQLASAPGRKIGEISANTKAVSAVLENIAKEKGGSMTGVALAYVMQKTPYVFPIVGCRTVAHLKGNIEALSLELSEADLEAIEGAAPFELGFPLSMIQKNAKENWLNDIAGHFKYVEAPKVFSSTTGASWVHS